jgi:hypothetical protein
MNRAPQLRRMRDEISRPDVVIECVGGKRAAL